MARAPTEKEGDWLGKYRLVSLVGTGGMGRVYRAVDTSAGREVALKILPTEAANQPNKLERFRREARHGARLRHENIVALYEFGEHEGTYYLAMEYVDGIDLEQYVRQCGTVPPDEARRILIQVVKALDHAYQAGVVHRDIKPANILLTQWHGRPVVKLADLGLARTDEETRVTTDGTTVGTVDYMAPEQAKDSRLADARSDIYSLGCSLYHMLAGGPPFASGSILERVIKHAKAEIPDVREINPDVPETLWMVCKRMLAKKPNERYQSPAELLIDLTSMPEPPAGSSGRHRPLQDEGDRRTAETRQTRGGSDHGQRIASGQFEAATRAVAAGNYDYALPMLLECCRRDPNEIQFRKAIRQAQIERASLPNPKPWRGGIAILTLKARFQSAKLLGRHATVLDLGEELLTCNPQDAATAFAMGTAAGALGHKETALHLLDYAHGLAPENRALQRALAVLVEEAGDVRRALKLWEAVARGDPNDHDAKRKVRDLLATKTYGKNIRDQEKRRRKRS